jgi:signal transduction histidine kinase
MAASDTQRSDPGPREAGACLDAPRLRERLEEEINRAGRHSSPLGCLLVGIEELAAVERVHGSELTEQALVYVGLALRREFRRFDRVGRDGQGEFVVVLPGVDRLRAADRSGTRGDAQRAARRRPPRAARAGRAAARRASRLFRTHPSVGFQEMLSGSELWLLRLMADRGLALMDADTLLMVIEERRELRVAAASGTGSARVRILPVEGSALGAVYLAGKPLSLDRPRGHEASVLHELGLEARAVLIEPLSMEGHGGGLVIALRENGSFRDPDRRALSAFAASVAQRLAAERSVEIERLRYGMEARERERTRWAREIHDETVQGLGALRLKLANARDLRDEEGLQGAVDAVLEGLGDEIEGLRHLITELRPAALDDLGLVPALEALARRAQAIDGLEVRTEIDLPTMANGERLDAELESTIYRVVQEALTNVSRHAEATEAVVGVSGANGTIRVSVTDDGKGLSGAAMGPRGDGLQGGFGMSGMRERAELVGGELELGPAPGRGTALRLTVPLAGRPSGVAKRQG